MNKIELRKGDCLELMKDIEDKSVDMILCDLPYGTTQNKWDSIIDLNKLWNHYGRIIKNKGVIVLTAQTPFDKLWEQYKRIIKDNGAIVLTASQPFTSALIMSNIKMFKYEWIWQKNTTSGFALAKKQPMRNHENILIFYKKQPVYNYIKELRDLSEKSKTRMEYEFNSTKGKNQLQNGITRVKVISEDKYFCYPKSVQKINNIVNNNKQRKHPTQKPVALFEYLIKTYTNEGDLVLDNCVGSGTTNIACLNTNRRCIGIEKEEKYVKIARERILKELEVKDEKF